MNKKNFLLLLLLAVILFMTTISKITEYANYQKTEYSIPKIEGNGWFYIEGGQINER